MVSKIKKIEQELLYTRNKLEEINNNCVKNEKLSVLRYHDSLTVSIVFTLIALMHLVGLYIELYGTRAPGNYILFGILGALALVLVVFSIFLTKKISLLKNS